MVLQAGGRGRCAGGVHWPLTIAAVGLAKIALPLLALRLGPIALGFAAIINPVGVLIRLLGQLALQAGAASLLGRPGFAHWCCGADRSFGHWPVPVDPDVPALERSIDGDAAGTGAVEC